MTNLCAIPRIIEWKHVKQKMFYGSSRNMLSKRCFTEVVNSQILMRFESHHR